MAAMCTFKVIDHRGRWQEVLVSGWRESSRVNRGKKKKKNWPSSLFLFLKMKLIQSQTLTSDGCLKLSSCCLCLWGRIPQWGGHFLSCPVQMKDRCEALRPPTSLMDQPSWISPAAETSFVLRKSSDFWAVFSSASSDRKSSNLYLLRNIHCPPFMSELWVLIYAVSSACSLLSANNPTMHCVSCWRCCPTFAGCCCSGS